MDFHRGWQTPSPWEKKGEFGVLAVELLDPQNKLAQDYPHLHRVLRERLNDALAARPQIPLSRCDHTGFNGHELGRCDGATFQHEEDSELVKFLSGAFDNTSVRIRNLCGNLLNRMEIYGVLGEGTFASVFLARERNADIADPQHFAIKVEPHMTLKASAERSQKPNMAPLQENDHDPPRYIPVEALILLFLADSDRFPNVDSVYVHDQYYAIAMTPCVDDTPDRHPTPSGDWKRNFSPFTGRFLMERNHTPVLDEMQACKVASQLLQALFNLADMNIWHLDLSLWNFVVDEELNVTLIDLGSIAFRLQEEQFFTTDHPYLPSMEYLTSPELARELLRPRYQDHDWSSDNFVDLPYDTRQLTLWKFAVIVYGILHGFWPWDNPSPHETSLLRYDGDIFDEQVNQRRLRMSYHDVPINQNLSQDCKDVLSAMLARNPADRPNLEALQGFPWFNQWKYENRTWKRPYSAMYEDHRSRSTVSSTDSSSQNSPREDMHQGVPSSRGAWQFSRYPMDDSRRWREHESH